MLEWLRWFDTRAQRPVLLLMDNFSAHEAAVEILEASALPLKWTRIEWFPANTTSCFQPLDQGIIQNWKCYVRKELLRFLMVEFDAGRDYNKTHHVLRAIEWGIQAWAAVELQTISKCWQKGFQIEGPANLDQWSESLDLIQDIQSTARTIARNQGVQAPLDNIRDFIYPEVERVIDSEEDITTQIMEYYSLPEKDQDEEVGVEDIVEKVSISEAINALNTLKKYQGQRNQLANQDLMVQLQKELRSLQAERFNSQRQSDLIGWLGGRAEKGLN